MAQNVTRWVWENSRAENGALIVLLAIAHEAGRDGNAAMSVRQIAAMTRLGERSVRYALTDLARDGELSARPDVGQDGLRSVRVIMEGVADSATPRDADSATPPSGVAKSAMAESATPKTDTSQVNPRGVAKSATLKTSDVFISTTGRSEVPVKDVSAIAERPDVDRLCRHLADRIEANGCKRPEITKRWRDAARLLLDRDGKTELQVRTAIDWSQDHEFWRANILSMPKLREKYDQLRLQASRPATPANSRLAEKKQMLIRSRERAKAKEEADEANGNNGTGRLHQPGLPAAGHR